jgi:hypothetical protein
MTATWAGYINASYATPFSFADATWKAGAMYRKKKRENRYYILPVSILWTSQRPLMATDMSLRRHRMVLPHTLRSGSQLNYNSTGGTSEPSTE